MSDGVTVLFIVTPSGDSARADRLVNAVGAELERKGLRTSFDLQQARATDVDALQRVLLSHLSKGSGVVHLCARVGGAGVAFTTSDPGRVVSASALARSLELACSPLQMIALSDCFTPDLAHQLAQVSSPVLGTLETSSEETTTAFFVGFYRGFAFRDDVPTAFELGRNQVELHSLDSAACQLVLPGEANPTPAAPLQPVGPVAGSTVHNLRARNLSFTGRGALLDAVEARLETNGNVVVTQAFQGMGGVGKSELALEFAHRHLDAYAIAWWVGCEEVDAIAGQLDQLAVRVGLPGETPGERLEALDGWMATQQRWLLIADNVDDWAQVAPQLPRGGRGSVIVTTRQPGVHQDPIAVDVFTPAEANEFVARRLRQPGIEAEALANDLGRLPLALEQACSYILTTGCSLDEYRTRFERRHAQLMAVGTTGGHEGTVTATFHLSLEQAKKLADSDDYATEPEQLATLCAFLAGDSIPTRLLQLLWADADE